MAWRGEVWSVVTGKQVGAWLAVSAGSEQTGTKQREVALQRGWPLQGRGGRDGWADAERVEG